MRSLTCLARRVVPRLVSATILATLLAAPSHAVSLLLQPDSVTTSGSFSLDLVAQGLGAGAAPSVGGFDVTLQYDPGFVSFSDVSFGPDLGASISGQLPTPPGSVRAFAVSLLSPAQLDALQGANVTLASFEFDVVSLGVGQVDIGEAFLSDANAALITLTETRGAVVAAIPEPGAALAFALGTALVARWTASRRRIRP